MKKNTARLIVLAVILMIVLNGILITLLWYKQSPKNRIQRTPVTKVNEYIIQEMGFDEETAAKFIRIAKQHYDNQLVHQKKYREVKHQLNKAMINQNKEESEKRLNELTETVKAKELELYRFFSEVRKIMNEEQQDAFGQIFREATGAPDYERLPMNGGHDRPHPPKH